MTWSPDSEAPKDPSAWRLVAAIILGYQGFAAIFYSAILPALVTDVGVDVPLLGHMNVGWVAAGALAIAAAIGVARRRVWGRRLGTLSAILSIVTGLLTASSVALAVFVPVLPLIVLFALRFRWPNAATKAP